MAVGLAVESGWLFVLLKTVAALLGFLLLVRGHRLPRFTGGLFWLLVSLAISGSRLARTSYLLAALAALLVFYGWLWLQDRLPRLTMALASLLPLPLLWGVYIYFSGSFDFRPRVALLGAFIGLVAGALWPRAMLAPLACAMGIALLAWALPITFSFPALAAPALLACALQFYDLYRRRSGRAGRASAAAIRGRDPARLAKMGRRHSRPGLLLALFAPFGSPPTRPTAAACRC